MQGISYVLPPFLAPLIIRYPAQQRRLIWAGWVTCITALIASSFATKLWHLMMTQGLLYGIGYIMMFYPILSMMNEWFIERRGLAYGIMLVYLSLNATVYINYVLFVSKLDFKLLGLLVRVFGASASHF